MYPDYGRARARLMPLVMLALTTTAMAQSDDGGTDEAVEEIVVTASRASQRTAFDSAVPVDILTARQLQSTGAVAGELGEALATLSPAFNFPRQSNSGTSDLVRAGQLRGLSPDQMLVLVNGKRRHTSAIVNTETKIGRGTAAVDFNTIPLNAVERIEVLRDGAGALYGSDAIAGVVNVILDDSVGFSTAVSYGAHHTDVEPIDQTLTDGQTFTADAKYGWRIGERGFLKTGAAWRTRNATNRAGFDQIPFFVAPTPDNLVLQGQRNYAEGDPNVDELSLWFNTEVPLTLAEFYAWGTWADRESDGGAAFYRYPDSAANVREIYDEGFRPETRAEDRDIALVSGLRGEAGAWQLDGSVGYGRNRFEFGVDNSLNASLGPSSPTSFDSGTFIFDQLTVNLDAVREFESGWFGRPINLAAGLEYRRETYETEAGDPASFEAGVFDGEIGAQAAPGLTPDDVVDIDRDVVSAYLDAGVDITDRLFLEAAARLEEFSDFGSAATGKLVGRYELTPSVALRAAASNSFRAPNLAQLGFSDTSLNFGEDRTLIRTRTLRVNDPLARALGARNLDEERSVNLSAGAVARLGGLSLSLDVFRIDVEDRVTLSERLFSPALSEFLAAQPSGENVESVRFFTNAVDTETTGFDLVADYARPWASGDLQLTAAYHYASTEVEEIKETTPELADIDTDLRLIGVEEINTLEEAAPEDKLVLTGRWSNDRWRFLTRVSRFGSTVRVFNFGGGFEPRQEYGAETRLDLEGGYRFDNGLSLDIGVLNALDEYPDLSSADINFFGNLPYDILSPVGVNGRYLYLRARLEY